jgi:hypothetical protein
LREYLAQHRAAAPARRGSMRARTRPTASRAPVTRRQPSMSRRKKRR